MSDFTLAFEFITTLFLTHPQVIFHLYSLSVLRKSSIIDLFLMFTSRLSKNTYTYYTINIVSVMIKCVRTQLS